MFYSGYTWRQLYPTILVLLDCVTHQREHHPSVFAKYAEKKFKRASRFVEEYMSQGQYIEITEENASPHGHDSPE
jgi:Cyclin, C-terminal domain